MNKTAKKLYTESWAICHEIVALRDKKECIICRSEADLQLDHTISRNCKIIFFETDLLNFLCDRHHSAKTFRRGGPVDKMVDDVTRRRVGEKRWSKLVAKSRKLCRSWATVWWQEERNAELKQKLKEMANA